MGWSGGRARAPPRAGYDGADRGGKEGEQRGVAGCAENWRCAAERKITGKAKNRFVFYRARTCPRQQQGYRFRPRGLRRTLRGKALERKRDGGAGHNCAASPQLYYNNNAPRPAPASVFDTRAFRVTLTRRNVTEEGRGRAAARRDDKGGTCLVR